MNSELREIVHKHLSKNKNLIASDATGDSYAALSEDQIVRDVSIFIAQSNLDLLEELEDSYVQSPGSFPKALVFYHERLEGKS